MDDSSGLETKIRVEGLTKVYDRVEAVHDLTFQVTAGEVLGLVGPNGAGKTTTLRSIAGIIPPTAGHLEVAGHDVRSRPLSAKRELAFIPDDPRLFDYLTVQEHLRFIGRLYGVTRARIRGRQLIEELDLEGKETSLPGALSRGMRQKLAIACSLLHDPQVILFDEPLTGLDPMAIRRIKTAIHKRAEAGAAVIVSSHLLSLVEEISDRILVIQNGKKIVHGRLEELKATLPELDTDADLEEVFFRITEPTGSTGEEAR